MAILDRLEPKAVFSYFEQLCAIPHGSGSTKAVSDWLAAFARRRGLEHYQDAWNNIIIIKPAAPGYEAAPAVILQGHMDMVCEKEPGCTLDMEREGLRLAVEGDTVYAEGTTLGGDDGVAVAMMLALLEDGGLPHPRLECVFTVDEEIGMLGAGPLDVSPLRGRTMINLDSEAEGIFTASCAGGRVVECVVPVDRAPWVGAAATLTVEGLAGGHSGTEIHRGRANASLLLGRVLYALGAETEFRLASVAGGLKDNAIPARAEARVRLADPAAAEAVCRRMEAVFRAEYAVTDGGVTVTAAAAPPEAAEAPMDRAGTERIVRLLLCLPNGVQAMSADVEGLVETSLNLGILRTGPAAVTATCSVRSSVESRKEYLTERLQCLTAALGGHTVCSGDYPGWAFRRESPLRELMTAVFTEQYGHPPAVNAIHAGLECGLFAGKLPGLDCVAIGPDLTDIHTPRERLHIASTARTFALVKETLRRMR